MRLRGHLYPLAVFKLCAAEVSAVWKRPAADAACGGGRLVTSDTAWRTEGGRRSDMVREERQENGNPRCKSVRCALAEERGPEGEVRWMLWSEGTSRKQTKTESLKEASTPLTRLL